MTKLGFGDAAKTTAGADGGIDVVANNAVAQVKHYTSPVGSPAVQQLRGAAHGRDWALFYALSGYSRSAVDYAASANVALFTYSEAGHIKAVNDAATYLHEQAAAGGGIDVTEFELRQAEQQLAQRLLDQSSQLFLVMAQRAVDLAASNPKAAALVDSVEVESRRVRAAMAMLKHDSTIPMSEFGAIVQRIVDATERLFEEIAAHEP